MMVVTIEEAKVQLRVDNCYHGDDQLINRCIDTSVEHVAGLMGYESMEEAFPSGKVPETVRHAVLMFTVHYYENAGVVSAVDLKPVNQGALALIGRYIKYHNT